MRIGGVLVLWLTASATTVNLSQPKAISDRLQCLILTVVSA
ncbi:MAG: hypothetical protein AAF892_06715 [Cyanobacteria bacterium P01_D01_bin.71]